MSAETAQRLEEAKADEREQKSRADDQKRECLAAVARGIPVRVEEVAKRTAHSQPEVAKDLGREGIRRLREELADAAVTFASEVENATDQIEWPIPQSEYSRVEPKDIRSALFNFLYGSRVDNLASILKRYGFSTKDGNARRSQGLILPQDLFNEDGFAAVAGALNSLATAERAAAAAKAADDLDVVNALWDGD